MKHLYLLLLGVLGVWANQASANGPWRVAIELSVQHHQPGDIEARVNWLGATTQLLLRDDGTKGDIVSGDNIYTAVFVGAPTRYLGVTFSRHEGSAMVEGYRAVERVPYGGGTLRYGVADHTNLTLQRLSTQGTEQEVENREATRTAFGAVWTWICLICVLSLVPWRKLTAPVRTNSNWPQWTLPALWVFFATLWTWPAAIAGGDVGVGLHFDAYGTIWALSEAHRWLPGMVDGFTAWPLGADYSAFDSFTLLPVAWLFQWMDPIQLHALLGLLGVASSAWAAERFAHHLGADRPWSLIAGFAFGFSGMAATALLEGHVYHVMNPWLPLFGLYWWQSCGPKGKPKDGIWAGLFFSLTLLTTAYLGVAAGIIAVGFLVGGIARKETQAKAVLPCLGVVLPVAAAVFWGILENSVGSESIHRVLLGSARISNLGIPTPEIDRAGHSVAAALGGIAFALALLVPAILQPGRWKIIYWTGLTALVLSFGPALNLDTETTLIPLPTYPLWKLPLLGQIRFPIRLLWAWLLCSGVLAALAASALAKQKRVTPLLVMTIAHSFLFVALPFRQGELLTTTPSGYESVTTGAILELMAAGSDPSGEYDNWTSATSCLYQTKHGAPIAENCVSLPVQSNPRMRLQSWAENRLRDGEADTVRATLASLGFSAIAWHPDLYTRGDRLRLETALQGFSSVSKTTDGGENVWLYSIKPMDPGGRDLPEDIPSRQHGMESGKDDPFHHAFVELHVPQEPNTTGSTEGDAVSSWETHQYSVRYGAGNTERHIYLSNNGEAPGDWQDDFIWTGMLEGPLPASFPLTLISTNDQGNKILWKGDVALHTENDRLAYRHAGGTVVPVSASADRPKPPARRGAGIIGSIGALGWLAILALWALKRKRHRVQLG